MPNESEDAKPGRMSVLEAGDQALAIEWWRVIGEETLSSTSAFNLGHSANFSTTIKSFIQDLIMGNIGSHWDITSGHEGGDRTGKQSSSASC